MALPADLNTITVTGKYTQLSGDAATGSVAFQLQSYLIDSDSEELIVPTTLTATLDSSGEFSIVLPLSSDDDYSPETVYKVTESVAGLTRDPFNIQLDEADGSTISLFIKAPVGIPGTGTVYLTTSAADARYVRLATDQTVRGLTLDADNSNTPFADAAAVVAAGLADGTIAVALA